MRYLLPLFLLGLTGCATVDTPPLYHQMDKADVQLANQALAKALLEKHRIFTVQRDGLASGHCVRVTPALATRMAAWTLDAAPAQALVGHHVHRFAAGDDALALDGGHAQIVPR